MIRASSLMVGSGTPFMRQQHPRHESGRFTRTWAAIAPMYGEGPGSKIANRC